MLLNNLIKKFQLAVIGVCVSVPVAKAQSINPVPPVVGMFRSEQDSYSSETEPHSSYSFSVPFENMDACLKGATWLAKSRQINLDNNICFDPRHPENSKILVSQLIEVKRKRLTDFPLFTLQSFTVK